MRQGGCFCGAIRYQVESEPRSATHCHCLDCRRSSGAAFVTWVEFPIDDFQVKTGKMTARIHPPGIERTFCATCGTSLTFRRLEEDEIDVTAATLDEPEKLEPTGHLWCIRRLPWIHLDDHLQHFERNRPSD